MACLQRQVRSQPANHSANTGSQGQSSLVIVEGRETRKLKIFFRLVLNVFPFQNFEEEKLSKAKALFSRISSSTPPPGMEGKVKELEERFKNVVKQTEER